MRLRSLSFKAPVYFTSHQWVFSVWPLEMVPLSVSNPGVVWSVDMFPRTARPFGLFEVVGADVRDASGLYLRCSNVLS